MADPSAAGAVAGGSGPTARHTREYLARIASGAAPALDPLVWSALAPRGALAGSPAQPELTEVGRQVLLELEVRAYRTDGLLLDEAARELERTIAKLATMAETAEYFLAELGPVAPTEVIPLVRIVAANLAVRHESPEELVEEFKNGWGEVEVMGSTPEDRLLAAGLITGSGVPQDEVYSSMMTTVGRLSDIGCASPVATAAILHLYPAVTNEAPLDRWSKARERIDNDEGAALLAGPPDLNATIAQWEGKTAALGGRERDAQLTGVYLTASAPSYPAAPESVRAAAKLFEGPFAHPLLASAVALSHLQLSPEESRDWVEKAVAQTMARRLAPDSTQLWVLGLSLIVGLDPGAFARPGAISPPVAPSTTSMGVVARTALHGWMYRDLVRATPAS
jgi:hypothetical protein